MRPAIGVLASSPYAAEPLWPVLIIARATHVPRPDATPERRRLGRSVSLGSGLVVDPS
jgi:hypothetical protein